MIRFFRLSLYIAIHHSLFIILFPLSCLHAFDFKY